MSLKIKNNDVRKLWLDSQGLISSPTGPLNILQIIKKLGFVQLDTIQNVSRAHHHIIWSRNQNYREPMLENLLKTNQHIFEHFTHDASVIPIDFYPMWTRQFKRKKEKMDRSKFYKSMSNEKERAAILKRITEEGPLSTHAFDTKVVGEKKMWSRPPHKIALDYMWYSGELSTSHRESFKKFYNLTHRVIPDHIRNKKMPDEDQINWLCNSAFERLSFGSIKDIQKFWDATEPTEIKEWLEKNNAKIKEIQWQAANGIFVNGYATPDIEQRLANLQQPTSRIRIINPFDPAIRDRHRLNQIFGFDYKIEIFIPKHKRQWGYYVYPLLEKDRFIGRIELKANRQENALNVINFWPEQGTMWNFQKHKKLDAELNRLARLVGVSTVTWV